jgi:hypothetical protein
MTLFTEIYGAGTFATSINGVGVFDVSNTAATFGVPLNVNAGIFGSGAGLTGIPYSALTGTVPTWNQSTTGNALTSTSTLNCPYTGLTGTVPTWNQSTTGNALTSTSTLNCPYTGLTGTVPTWNQNTTGSAASVPYSGLTGTVPTWNQSTTGNALTSTSTLNCPYTGLTGTVPTWNQSTTGNATGAINILNGVAGTVPYQSASNTTLFTGVGVAGQILTSQGSAAPTWGAASDPTKLPLAGGTMNGSIAMGGNIAFSAGSCAYNYKLNQSVIFDNTSFITYQPTQINTSIEDTIVFTNTSSCNLSLVNFNTDTTGFYQDGVRNVTVIKRSTSFYTVLILPPTSYLFYSTGLIGAANYTMDGTTFSVTLRIVSKAKNNSSSGAVYVISKT